eukprot:COSAG03_NODE_456_length_7759_cov_122.878068_11_plen_61_part_00
MPSKASTQWSGGSVLWRLRRSLGVATSEEAGDVEQRVVRDAVAEQRARRGHRRVVTTTHA